jgi:hyperosmotically inducible protein
MSVRVRHRRIAVFAMASLLGAGCGDQGGEPGGMDTRDDGGPSPLAQSEGGEDVQVTQRIRQALVADDSLSTSAKNVTIVARDNTVTLRGDVQNEQERATIVQKVQQIAANRAIDNQLQVAGDT